VDAGNGSAIGEGHGDGGGRNVVGIFGDDHDIERAESEEGRLQLATELFDGGADGFDTIMRIVKKPVTGVCGVADLVAEEGHRLPLSGGEG